MEAKYPKFDAEGVKEHYQELSRQRYIQQGRREVVEWIEPFIETVDDPEFNKDWEAQKKLWLK